MPFENSRSAKHDHRTGARDASRFSGTDRQLFWGDLHNHNAVGYAQGSLERSIDLAREHLDFFAFTGHASWHDMPKMPGDRHLKWVNGFEVHRNHWPKTRQLIHDANGDDNFVAFLGYEWHSSHFGDFCVIFPGDGELYLPDHADKLLDWAHDREALAIPHHVGYKQGWRGANWNYYRADTAPVVEIFSEHGCTETERAPFPMIRHSNGGRSTANMIQRQLAKGMRFGFVASSDDHRGYPGAYGEGVVGVWAEDLSRQGIMEAILARRTYAATGDRIGLEVALNGRPMGAELAHTDQREIDVRATGQDSIAMIELVRNGRVVDRHFPADATDGTVKLPGRAKCRIQYGWGPWAALNLGRVCDWEMTVRIDGGKFLRALPCFQAAPFDEGRRDRLQFVSDTELTLSSPTTRLQAYGEDPTKSLVLEVEGNADTTLSIEMKQPIEKTYAWTLAQLAADNAVEFTGVFTSESFIVGPLISPSEYSAEVRFRDTRTESDEMGDCYYVRVVQHNGHMAWSSPIWVG